MWSWPKKKTSRKMIYHSDVHGVCVCVHIASKSWIDLNKVFKQKQIKLLEQCSKHVVTISLTYSIGYCSIWKLLAIWKVGMSLCFWAMLTRLQWLKVGQGLDYTLRVGSANHDQAMSTQAISDPMGFWIHDTTVAAKHTRLITKIQWLREQRRLSNTSFLFTFVIFI